MIEGVFGNLGTGKTLFLVKRAVDYFKAGFTVYANFSIKGISQPIRKTLDLMELENCVACLDDIIPWLDSRKSSKQAVVTWFLMRSRKVDEHILYSSQILTGEDLRLRAITNVIWLSELIEFPEFKVEGYSPDGRLLTRFNIRYGSNIYNLYDTKEIVDMRISLGDLKNMFLELDGRVLFSNVLALEYSIDYKLACTIWDLLEKENYERVRKMFRYSGYKLEGEGGGNEAKRLDQWRRFE